MKTRASLVSLSCFCVFSFVFTGCMLLPIGVGFPKDLKFKGISVVHANEVATGLGFPLSAGDSEGLVLKVDFTSKSDLSELSRSNSIHLGFDAFFSGKNPEKSSRLNYSQSVYWNNIRITPFAKIVASKNVNPLTYQIYLNISNGDQFNLRSSPENVYFCIGGGQMWFGPKYKSNEVTVDKDDIVRALNTYTIQKGK